MSNYIDPRLISNGVAAFCVLMIGLAFIAGYGKSELDIMRRARKEWKEKQAKLPRAKR